MSNLQIIEALCKLVEMQSGVISMLAMELQHERNLTEAEAEVIESARQRYSAIIGADEVPDDLMQN